MTARRNQEEANGLRGSGRKTMSNAPKNIRRARAGARPSEGLVDLHVTNTLLTTNTKWELTGITLLRRFYGSAQTRINIINTEISNIMWMSTIILM